MEPPETEAPDQLPEGSVPGAEEWAEITRLVSISLPDETPEVWLGQLVMEAQTGVGPGHLLGQGPGSVDRRRCPGRGGRPTGATGSASASGRG